MREGVRAGGAGGRRSGLSLYPGRVEAGAGVREK